METDNRASLWGQTEGGCGKAPIEAVRTTNNTLHPLEILAIRCSAHPDGVVYETGSTPETAAEMSAVLARFCQGCLLNRLHQPSTGTPPYIPAG